MARPTRDVRRRSLNIGNLSAGDYVLLVVSFVLFLALILNWWVSGASVNAVKFSQFYFVIVLILILVTLGLIVYPLLEAEANLRPLPFATAPLLLAIGFLLLLMTTYELGRYNGIGSTVNPGFGLWLAFVCSWLYLLGALIKWGSRQRQLTT